MATWQPRVGLSWSISIHGVSRDRAGPIVVSILRRPADLAVEPVALFTESRVSFYVEHDQNTE